MAESHVTTWNELHTALNNQSNAIVYLDNDIDCNDEIPEGTDNTTRINLNGGSYSACKVYGQGHSIRNFRITGTSKELFYISEGYGTTRWTEIHDVNFENILVNSTIVSTSVINIDSSSYTYPRFYRCRFSGEILRGSLVHRRSYNHKPIFYQCSMKFKLGENGYIFYPDEEQYGYYLSDCIINVISGKRPLSKIIPKGTKIKGTYSNITLVNESTSNESAPHFTTSESVIDANVSGNVELSDAVSEARPATAVLVNSDRVQGTIASGLLQANSTQMTDAAYLDSIGFPIGVDE